MEQIRRSVFETNSSSSHSVSLNCYSAHTLSTDKSLSTLLVDYDDYVHVSLGEFGWEIEDYSDAMTKLSYLVTMICEVNNIETHGWADNYSEDKMRSELEECDDFIKLNELIIKETGSNGLYVEGDGYIDHQSWEDYHSMADFLNDWDVTAYDFIFDPCVVLHTDNDNH